MARTYSDGEKIVGALFALLEVQQETKRLDEAGELYQGHPIFARHDEAKARYDKVMEEAKQNDGDETG